MHQIVIQYAVAKKTPSSNLLKRWAIAALTEAAQQKYPLTQIELTIRIVDTQEMQQLNSTYRQKMGPTNVLAFPYDSLHQLNDGILYLGDIVICQDIVMQEAIEQNKLEKAHWAHMVIHGTLHLLGYDHIVEEDATIMETKEIDILNLLGFPNPYQLCEG